MECLLQLQLIRAILLPQVQLTKLTKIHTVLAQLLVDLPQACTAQFLTKHRDREERHQLIKVVRAQSTALE